MPTRFKYVPIASQSFALTPAEILLATDQELNQFMSIKKYAPYRKESSWNKGRQEKLVEFKQQIHERAEEFGWDLGPSGGRSKQVDESVNGEKAKKKRKGKKERMKMKAAAAGTAANDEDEDEDEPAKTGSKRGRPAHDAAETIEERQSKKRKRHKHKESTS